MSGHDDRIGAQHPSSGRPLSDSGLEADASLPSTARVYDALLGGKDHYVEDSDLAAQVTAAFPQVERTAQAARGFLRRAVTHLALRGFDQFLDIGAGMPAPGYLGDVLEHVAPWARLVAVDNDPVAVSHGYARLVSQNPQTTAFIQADLREPAAILENAAVKNVLDLDRPTVLVLGAVLHFVSDQQDPAGIVRTLLSGLVPGSAVVISHASADFDPDGACAATVLYNQLCRVPLTLRSRERIGELVSGLAWIGSGLVQACAWGPESTWPVAPDRAVWVYGGVGLLPRPSADGAWSGAAEPGGLQEPGELR